MRILLGILFMFMGVVGALYISIWWGIIEPIFYIADAVASDTVTIGLVAWEIAKFLLKGVLATIVYWIFWGIGIILMDRQ